MSPNSIVFKGEMQLLSWSNSATGGPKLVLALQDADALTAFQSMTMKKGKRAGQRLMVVVVEIGDDEKPVEQERDGPKRSQLAYLMCDDPDFQRWANANQWEVSVTNHDEARTYICQRCGIDSRSELDRDASAAARFDEMKDEYDTHRDRAYHTGVSA